MSNFAFLQSEWAQLAEPLGTRLFKARVELIAELDKAVGIASGGHDEKLRAHGSCLLPTACCVLQYGIFSGL